MGNQDERYPVNQPPMQPPAARPGGASRPLAGNTPRPEPTRPPVRRLPSRNVPPPNDPLQRRSLGRTLNDAFTGMQAAIQRPQRDRPRRDAGDPNGPPAPRWDEPQGQRDPWDRQWAAWSERGGASDDRGYGDAGYAGEDRHQSRAAWGGWPEAGTRASVAMNAVGARKNTQRRSSASQARAQSFAELRDWARTGFSRQAMPSRKAINLLLVVCILGVGLLSTVGLAFAGYNDYSSVLAGAKDGQAALTHMGEDLGIGKSGKTTDTSAAYNDLTQALNDFQMVHDRLAHPDFILGVAGHLPIVDQKLQSGLALSAIGIQAIQMMQTIFPAIVSISKVIATSPISATGDADNVPASEQLNVNDIANIKAGFDKAQPYINSMIGIVNNTPPDTLAAALNSKQKSEILPFLQFVPQLPNAIQVVSSFLPIAPTVLGITDPKGNPLPGGVAYALTTLDNSEIRPVGGFQGQMAIFGVDGGHISHISLQDIYQLEATNQPWSNYSSNPSNEGWWPLDYNMRNSGLSPDFPTTAQLFLNEMNNQPLCKTPLTTPGKGTDQIGCSGSRYYVNANYYDSKAYYSESNHVPIVNPTSGAITGYNPTAAKMGGMIVIQQTIIKQLLQRTGPIQVGCPYNVSVNPSNLQQLIHYYQETTAGRKIGANPCTNGAGSSDATKRFSSIVATTLLNKLKTISKTDLLAYVGDLLQDLKTRDIQIYLADPTDGNFGPYAAGQKFLTTYNDANTVYTGTGDSLLVNQANYAGDKLNLYTSLKVVDHITLNHKSAHHKLELDYIYNIPTIKVNPADATVDPLAGSLQAWQVDVYNTIFNAQYSNFYAEYRRVYVPKNAQFDYNDPATGLLGSTGANYSVVAGPVAEQSDVPNRKAFANYYQYNFGPSPDGSTISWGAPDGAPNPTMSWDVPNTVQNGTYSLMLQRQSGVPTTADITVSCANGKTLTHLAQAITVDTPISVATAGC